MAKLYKTYLDVCCLNQPFDRSQTLENIGFQLYDSFQIVCAEASPADILLATDPHQKSQLAEPKSARIALPRSLHYPAPLCLKPSSKTSFASSAPIIFPKEISSKV